jgi:hypothetical protein
MPFAFVNLQLTKRVPRLRPNKSVERTSRLRRSSAHFQR